MSPDEERSSRPSRYVGTAFERQDVLLDGVTFDRCTFGPRCRLIFRGEAMPRFDACDVLDRVELILGGHAALTLQLLSVLYHSGGRGGRETVESALDDLRRGQFQPDGHGRGAEGK